MTSTVASAAGEPHDELTGLAAAFDRMLDRLAASLRHEQRFSAELSHELRTPLAAILAEAELIDDGSASDSARGARAIQERSGTDGEHPGDVAGRCEGRDRPSRPGCDAVAVVMKIGQGCGVAGHRTRHGDRRRSSPERARSTSRRIYSPACSHR